MQIPNLNALELRYSSKCGACTFFQVYYDSSQPLHYIGYVHYVSDIISIDSEDSYGYFTSFEKALCFCYNELAIFYNDRASIIKKMY